MLLTSTPQWAEIFSFSVPPLELVVRGTLMYWFIFLLLRVGGRRDVGSIGTADMLILVLIADAAQNGMAGQYDSLVDGMILVGTLFGWSVTVNYLAFHFPALARLLTADRVCLIREGIIARRNLRREFITENELMSELRQQGFDDVTMIRRAYIEPDGHISVLPIKGTYTAATRRNNRHDV